MWICAGEYRGRTIKGFITYVAAKVEEYVEEMNYKIYMSDILKGIAQQNKLKVNKRYVELLPGFKEEREKDGGKIIAEFLKKTGIEVTK